MNSFSLPEKVTNKKILPVFILSVVGLALALYHIVFDAAYTYGLISWDDLTKFISLSIPSALLLLYLFVLQDKMKPETFIPIMFAALGLKPLQSVISWLIYFTRYSSVLFDLYEIIHLAQLLFLLFATYCYWIDFSRKIVPAITLGFYCLSSLYEAYLYAELAYAWRPSNVDFLFIIILFSMLATYFSSIVSAVTTYIFIYKNENTSE